MNSEKQQYNLIQRTVFFIGIAALTGLVSVLIYEMAQHTKTPPLLEISTIHQPAEPNNSYQVWIKNLGEETAENTTLILNLYQDGEVAETGTISINYVPPGSKEEAWIVFYTDSKSGDSLVVSSVTYVIP